MILALHAAGATTSVWLFDQAPPARPTVEWESGRTLADQLLARLSEAIAHAGQQPADLAGIIVYSGPGSFTSLRIGHSVANALADSLGVPVVGAQGEHWLADGLAALSSTPAGRPALPHYGANANITKPKA
ncbi:MAG TPA: tRNA (adenosine(37)-N6)-threonylcarbamoyltransferase complex dimerization subunit type 1 TsaB [Candidatus Saccharimonas sp.]|nr:tRNA (adenosine(37)-N6)-threonylcarbamoyltransferase complex dimerization subunit type 1 TsaB [Candidatus Saccharimonas sp.]